MSELSNVRFVCALPRWAGKHTRLDLLTSNKNPREVMVIHDPSMPPHVFNEETGEWEEANGN